MAAGHRHSIVTFISNKHNNKYNKMSLKSDAVIERIRARLGKVDPAKRELTNIYKCRITVGGKVVKTWIMDLKNVNLYEGDDSAECTLVCDDQAFADMADKKMEPKQALEKGQLSVDGEMELAMKLLPYIASI
ncbi:uncharacterized protein LOC119653109 [Hermetia illucens]|nr:uncharacterized protein LOC119653109 [Hermetia illucens]